MSKSCFQNGCLKSPAFTCDCSNQIYFCKKHMGDHMMIKKLHNLAPLLIILDEPEESQIKEKCFKITEICSNLYKKTLQFTKKLIDSIISTTNQHLQELKQIESVAFRIQSCIFQSLPIDVDDLKFINDSMFRENFSSDFDSSNLENFIESMIEKYIKDEKNRVFKVQENNDLLIFSRFKENERIYAIDLETHEIQSKPIKWEYKGEMRAVVQYGKNVFLTASTKEKKFNQQSSVQQSELYIQKFDLNTLKFENISLIESVPEVGMTLFNESLYFFTGNQESFEFQLESKKWIRLTNFPLSCKSITASICHKKILATGFPLKKIYTYETDHNRYLTTITLNQVTAKFLFEDWLVCFNDSLYQIKEDWMIVKCQDFNHKSKSLLVYSGFRRDQFIYFLAKEGYLYRIDTLKKSITLVEIN